MTGRFGSPHICNSQATRVKPQRREGRREKGQKSLLRVLRVSAVLDLDSSTPKHISMSMHLRDTTLTPTKSYQVRQGDRALAVLMFLAQLGANGCKKL